MISFISLGRYTIFVALLACIYAIIASILAYLQKDERLQKSAIRAAFATAALVFLSGGYLWKLLLFNNYEVQYVWQYTDSTLSSFLRLSAFWAGQRGSLLLWSTFLCIYTVFFAWKEREHTDEPLSSCATAVLMGINLFFLLMLNTVSHPFDRQPQGIIPFDGNGLNPLLQHWAMIIHPPTLFVGYVGFAVPFAYAMGALLSGEMSNEWIRRSRMFTMVPFTALTIGIILGGKWAYEELGWGGYWAWDPVENASFIPWLIGTAYVHSIMIQERRPMLRVWNVSLVSLTFLTCILGTYLTRSGVLQSVHSFGVSPLGNFFLGFLLLCTAFTATVILARKDQLKSDRKLESLFSREAAFLANNVVFLSFAFIVFVGTVAPAVVKGLFGQEISIREPFFNLFAVPFGFVVLFLTGVGPLISWRAATFSNFRNNFLYPTVAGVISVPMFFLSGITNVTVVAFWALCVFVLGTIFQEMYKGARTISRKRNLTLFEALTVLVDKNRRRYGGYIVHLGIVIILIGISASSAYQIERDVILGLGESHKIGYALKDFEITYEDLKFIEYPKMDAAQAIVRVNAAGGASQSMLTPEKQMFHKSQQPHTEVETVSTFSEDFYIILTEFDETGRANFKLYINPLVNWIWFGAVVIFLGAGIAMSARFGRGNRRLVAS